MTKVLVPVLVEVDDDIANGLRRGDLNAYEILRELLADGLPVKFPWIKNYTTTYDRVEGSSLGAKSTFSVPVCIELQITFSLSLGSLFALDGPMDG